MEIASLNPSGRVFFPNIIGQLVGAFNFQRYPTKPEDFDEAKGVTFLEGNWRGVNVPKMQIYNNGIVVDTQASTDESERIFVEAMEWARENLGLTFNANMIQRRRYLSDIVVTSDVPILDGLAPIQRLTENMQAFAAAILEDEHFKYGGVRLDIDFERFQRQAPIAPFPIQRRQNSLFRDGAYYSEAPLPTALHFELLQKYEEDVRSMLNAVARK